MSSLKQTEADFQRAVIDLAGRLGWSVAHFHDSRRQVAPGRFVGDMSAAGFPDLVLARPPRLAFAELKSQKGRISTKQWVWLAVLERCEQIETYVWRPSDWDLVEQVLA